MFAQQSHMGRTRFPVDTLRSSAAGHSPQKVAACPVTVPRIAHAMRPEIDGVRNTSAWFQPVVHALVDVRQGVHVLQGCLRVDVVHRALSYHGGVGPGRPIGDHLTQGRGVDSHLADRVPRSLNPSALQCLVEMLVGKYRRRKLVSVQQRIDSRKLTIVGDCLSSPEQLHQFVKYSQIFFDADPLDGIKGVVPGASRKQRGQAAAYRIAGSQLCHRIGMPFQSAIPRMNQVPQPNCVTVPRRGCSAASAGVLPFFQQRPEQMRSHQRQERTEPVDYRPWFHCGRLPGRGRPIAEDSTAWAAPGARNRARRRRPGDGGGQPPASRHPGNREDLATPLRPARSASHP